MCFENLPYAAIINQRSRLTDQYFSQVYFFFIAARGGLEMLALGGGGGGVGGGRCE